MECEALASCEGLTKNPHRRSWFYLLEPTKRKPKAQLRLSVEVPPRNAERL